MKTRTILFILSIFVLGVALLLSGTKRKAPSSALDHIPRIGQEEKDSGTIPKLITGTENEHRMQGLETGVIRWNISNGLEAARFPEEVIPKTSTPEWEEWKLAFSRMTGNNMASACVVIHVEDSAGNPVPDADVSISYATECGTWATATQWRKYEGASDENGVFKAIDETFYGVRWSVRKKGYYDAFGKIDFHPFFTLRGFHSGKWFEKDVHLPIVLKDILSPCASVEWMTHGIIRFQNDTPIGFDVERREFLPPLGNGIHEDFRFHCSTWQRNDQWEIVFSVEVNGNGCGIYRIPLDQYSALRTPYRFHSENAQNVLTIRSGFDGTRRFGEISFPSEDCAPFRIHLSDGFHVGYLTGFSGANRHLQFGFSMNPTPNDERLEFMPAP